MKRREDGLTPKQAHYARVFAAASVVLCACGCGAEMKDRDLYARPRRYISGHNARKFPPGRDYRREYKRAHPEAVRRIKCSYHRRRKVQLIRLHGGSCVDCDLRHDGNNACVFHFHHRDPKQKRFAVGNQVTNKAWADIVAEAGKCDLLCANCHEMRHGGGF